MTQIDLSSKSGSLSGKDTWSQTDAAIMCVDNQIGADGARAVAEALNMNQTVAQIKLRRTCWSGNGGEIFRE